MDKWKWGSYYDYGYDERYRLYRYNEIDSISVGDKITSVFQFQLMSKNVQLSNNCLKK